MFFISIAFILSSAWCYALLTKRRFENFVFPALAADVLILYFFAIGNALSVGFWAVIGLKIALVAGTVALLYCRKQKGWSDFKNFCCTPGVIFLLVGTAFLFWLAKEQLLRYADELGWWGLTIRSAYFNDALPLLSRDITSRFLNYPPGTQVWNYLFLRLFASGYHETLCFHATNILAISVYATFYRNTSWKNWPVIILLGCTLLVIPVYFVPTFYASLFVDLILGVVFGAAMYLQSTGKNDIVDALILLVVCSFLILIKRSGIFLATLVLLPVCINAVFDFCKGPKSFLKKWKQSFVFIIPLLSYLVYASWQWAFAHYKTFAHGNFEVDNISLKRIFEAIVYNCPERATAVMTAFFKNLFFTPNYPIATFKISVFSMFLLLCILLVFVLHCFPSKQEIKGITRALVVLFVGFFVYSFSLMMLYIFTFVYGEAIQLASFVRYESTFLVGICFFLIGVVSQCPEKIVQLICFGLSLLYLPACVYEYKFLPTYQPYKTEIMKQIMASVDCDKVYGINQGYAGEPHIVYDLYKQYDEFISIATDGKDPRRKKISPEKLLETLKEKKYCYLARTDQILKDQYGIMFRDPSRIADQRLFQYRDGKLEQVPIKKFVFNFDRVSLLQEIKPYTKKAKTFYDINDHCQTIRILPTGSIILAGCPMRINQPVKTLSVTCRFVSGDADLKIKYFARDQVVWKSAELHKGTVTYYFKGDTQMDKLWFEFVNNGKENTTVQIKDVTFTFDDKFLDQR